MCSEDPGEVRKLIGLSGQFAAVDEHLTGYENLDMIGRLYHLGTESAPDLRPASYSSSSIWPTRPTDPSRPTREACGGDSTWPQP